MQAEIGPIDYPDSYASPARVHHATSAPPSATRPRRPTRDRLEWFCFTCTFRPWADTGDVAEAYVTIVRTDGTTVRKQAVRQGDRWTISRLLLPGERAYVAAGDVVDAFGNMNGAASPELSR